MRCCQLQLESKVLKEVIQLVANRWEHLKPGFRETTTGKSANLRIEGGVLGFHTCWHSRALEGTDTAARPAKKARCKRDPLN